MAQLNRIIERFLEISPDFRERWEGHFEYWNGDERKSVDIFFRIDSEAN